MTAPAKAKGILRSRPRYPSASNGGANAGATRSECSPADADTPAPTHADADAAASTRAAPLDRTRRSLADLVKCSTRLSDEASGISEQERGHVVTHGPIQNDNGIQVAGGEESSKNVVDTASPLPILRIAKDGTPHLKAAGATEADDGEPIAVGVLGKEGQQVRFCEYERDDAGGTSGDAASGRERLERRVEAHDEDFDVTDEEEDTDEEESSGGSDHDDEILAELGISEMMFDEEDGTSPEDAREKRVFLVLWDLLARLATPATIELVCRYQGKEYNPPASKISETAPCIDEEKSSAEYNANARSTADIGASRAVALMRMLKMHVSRSFVELQAMCGPKNGGVGAIGQREVEQRLADLVRTFDASARAADLNTKTWKVLTTVLIAIACPSLGTTSSAVDVRVPPSVQRLEMSVEEYRYLTRSLIASLAGTD